MRGSFHQVLAAHNPQQVRDILDIGCSVGISTLTLHRYYDKIQGTPPRTVGLDLSPYMLAVAKTRDTNREISAWIHANAEKTNLPPTNCRAKQLKPFFRKLFGYCVPVDV